MELFQKARVVRLRNQSKYLLAHDDEEEVFLDRNGSTKNAKWTVELVDNALRLKSCYGRYLTASDMPLLLGMRGKKVLQAYPKKLDSSLEWEPVRSGSYVRLKTRTGQYLRANGGLPPWRNAVTHDTPHRTAAYEWVLWDLDVVEIASHTPRGKRRPLTIIPPERCAPSSKPDPSSPKIELRSPRREFEEELSPASRGRIIYYDVADDNGAATNVEKSFTFMGKTLGELKERLKEETGIADLLVCTVNPLNGKLYPLHLHLPPNNTAMHVVIVKNPKSPRQFDDVEEENCTYDDPAA